MWIQFVTYLKKKSTKKCQIIICLLTFTNQITYMKAVLPLCNLPSLIMKVDRTTMVVIVRYLDLQLPVQ